MNENKIIELLKENEELKYKYDKALSDVVKETKKEEQLQKENEELKNFRKNFVDVTDKELKEANDYFLRKYTFMGDELAQHINTLLKVTSNSIPVQKVKDKIKEIQKEYNKLDEQIDKYLNNDNKDLSGYYENRERISTMQTLSWCIDSLQELIEEREENKC